MDVLLIEDHKLLCDALALLIGTRHPQVRLQVAGTLAGGLALGRAMPGPLLVLLDLGLPDASGLHGVRTVHEQLPQARVVVMSADERPETVNEAIALGASGYVPKTADLHRLEQALMSALDGRIPLPPAVVSSAQPVDMAEVEAVLTPRQLDVLRLLVAGQPNKRICSTLNLSESAVKSHLEAVYRRLGVNSRTQAVVAAARRGLVLSPIG
jgi:DNA-binding NarL/FixJ family response regulator